jgi:hypothetical protein
MSYPTYRSYSFFNDFINLCLTNGRFKKIILDNEYLWKQRYIRDFGIENSIPKFNKCICIWI